MRVLAVLFRLFSLFGLLALCGMLWLKFDTLNKQLFHFSMKSLMMHTPFYNRNRKQNGKTLGEKKSIFNDVL